MRDVTVGAIAKMGQNAQQGRRTILLYFYAGHGALLKGDVRALTNSNRRGVEEGGNEYNLEIILRNTCA